MKVDMFFFLYVLKVKLCDLVIIYVYVFECYIIKFFGEWIMCKERYLL